MPVEDQRRADTVPGSGRCHACGEPRRTARQEGFDLEAGVWVPAEQRDRLERLCRYALRPTVAQDRLRLTAEGQIVLQLRHPWVDGTTHLLFDPLELLERLAVLTLRQAQGHPEQRRGMNPRPRINLILYHGILRARAAWSFDAAHETGLFNQDTDTAVFDSYARSARAGAASPEVRSTSVLTTRVRAARLLVRRDPRESARRLFDATAAAVMIGPVPV